MFCVTFCRQVFAEMSESDPPPQATVPNCNELCTLQCRAAFTTNSKELCTLPVFQWTGVDVGSGAFFMEQRFWINSLGLDGVEFRKQEHKRHIWDKIREAYDLTDADLCRPLKDGDMARVTPLVTPRGLLGWLLTRHYMVAKSKSSTMVMVMGWRNALCGYSTVMASGMVQMQQQAAMPSLVVDDDLTLYVTADCKLDMTPMIVDRWHQMAQEWSWMAEAFPSAQLAGAFQPECVDLMQLVLFLDFRIRRSSPLGSDHWLQQLRSALITVAAYAVELFIFTSSSEANARDVLPVLYGANGQRKCHGQKWWRQRLMSACRASGSNNTIGRTVSGVESASAMSSVARIHLYTLKTHKHFGHASRVHLHHDGSGHNGHDVILGIALEADGGRSSYLRPQAMYQYIQQMDFSNIPTWP